MIMYYSGLKCTGPSLPDTDSLFFFPMAISIPVSASRRITSLARENLKLSENL